MLKMSWEDGYSLYVDSWLQLESASLLGAVNCD